MTILLLIDKYWRSFTKLSKAQSEQIRSIIYAFLLILAIIIIFIQLTICWFQSTNEQCYHHQLINLDDENLGRTIYVITPTYSRHVQKADLTRLANTLILIPNLHWILVEDSIRLSSSIKKFTSRLSNKFNFHNITLLNAVTPDTYKLKPGDPTWKYPKGIWQRNRGLDWLTNTRDDIDSNGIIYFADDDNTYDLQLFTEIRKTKMISVWPVAFVGGLLVEKPEVNSNGKVVRFNSMWQSQRSFPIDMAAFAISVKLYQSNEQVRFSHKEPIGYVESNFIKQLVENLDMLEPRSINEILVWHTKTQKPSLHEERRLSKPSNENMDW